MVEDLVNHPAGKQMGSKKVPKPVIVPDPRIKKRHFPAP